MRTRMIAALLLGGALLVASGPAASATDDSLQSRIDAVLEEFPGGVQIAPDQVSWESGEVILTLEGAATPFSVGNCATGAFCAYTGSSLSGTRLQFTNCSGTNSVAPLGAPVRSVANARTSGSVYAYNGSTKVLTVAAASWKNTTATVTRLGC